MRGPNPCLEKLDVAGQHEFTQPAKKIHSIEDVQSKFLVSRAYKDIATFLLQLNRALVPTRHTTEDGSTRSISSWPLGSKDVHVSEPVRCLQSLLHRLESFIDDVPPETGPRRFGNAAFRRWHERFATEIDNLFSQYLRPGLDARWTSSTSSSADNTAQTELNAYLLGAFGSAQRLDYGTGHELSFLAFLAALWKLDFFCQTEPYVEERGIVLVVFEMYSNLIRRLIRTYTLEPAGSHGVWGLDDHFFLPYIFGSAQYACAVTPSAPTPLEGSLTDAPEPGDIVRQSQVSKLRNQNMYFSAIGFINDVKSGPFWEHSPMLFDISGIRDGWGKINKVSSNLSSIISSHLTVVQGMIKMYSAEVLSKFPVVQHFPFGSLFSWERAPDALPSSPPRIARMPPPPTSKSHRNPTATTNMSAPWVRTPDGSQLPLNTSATARPANASDTQRDILRAPPQSTSSATDSTQMKAPWANK